MKSFKKWIFKYKPLSWILFSALEIYCFVRFLSRIDFPIWGISLISIFVVLLNYVGAELSLDSLLAESLSARSKYGNPEPLFTATKELLTFRCKATERLVLLINHSVALREMGELQKAYDILMDIDIEDDPRRPPAIKMIYYNNLSDLYDLLGNTEKAECFYEKMMQVYQNMQETKLKHLYENTVALASAEHYLRIGDPQQTMRWVTRVEPKDLTSQTSVNLIHAKLNIRANKPDEAIPYLREVIDKGNQLYAVQIAKQLLNELNDTQSNTEKAENFE